MSSSISDSLLYYADGSNLHPERLGARIPSSEFVGIAELSGYQLAFHKRGGDESAKCNALYTGDTDHRLLGAVFTMAASEKPVLDEIEGAGYVVEEVSVELNGDSHRVFMYIAEADYIDDELIPFQWYKDFVYLGAQYHNFPDHYMQLINAVNAIHDQNNERHSRNEQVLALMR